MQLHSLIMLHRLRLSRSLTTTIRWYTGGPVTAAYNNLTQSGQIRRDDRQVSLAAQLDELHTALAQTDSHALVQNQLAVASSDSSWSQKLAAAKYKVLSTVSAPPRGLYIHGSVGVGKSFLMDLFHEHCHNATHRRRRRRVHFHEFMLQVHSRIHACQQRHPRRRDAVAFVALELAQEAQLLCLDEFQVTDIADAMILKTLFTQMFDLGVVVVSTSNRPPEALYEGGLNRSLFLPFIDILKDSCHVFAMDSQHDYRRELVAEGEEHLSYFWPASDCREQLQRIFGGRTTTTTTTTTRSSARTQPARPERVPVMMGRSVTVTRATESCAWMDFTELCHEPLGAADYLALAERFSTIIVDSVPQLGANQYNEARRFVTLIDALYEARTRLVIAADVPMHDLFVDFDATVESHDGDEELAVEGVPVVKQEEGARMIQPGVAPIPYARGESWVNGEGGSSSSNSTTMIRTAEGNVEWSATGRVGVSLAQLSAVQDVAFSFRRAASRLVEMSGSQWCR